MNPDPIADALGAQANPAASDVFQLAVESADEVAETKAAARAKLERAAKIDELCGKIRALPGGSSFTDAVRFAYRKLIELGLQGDEEQAAKDAVWDWARRWGDDVAAEDPSIEERARAECATAAWGIVHGKDPSQPLDFLGVKRCPQDGSVLERDPDRPRRHGCSECSFEWEADE